MKKRSCLVSIIVCFLASMPLGGCVLLDDHDDFGKDIVIPPGMKVDELEDVATPAWGKQQDSEDGVLPSTDPLNRTKLDETANDGDHAGAIVNVELPSFHGSKRGMLIRHLATSCKWRVTEEEGKLFAVRREVDEYGNWSSDLNGFITRFVNPRGLYSVRTVIGIDGKIYADRFHAQAIPAKSETLRLPCSASVNHEHETYLCDEFGPSVLEIFEESPVEKRAYTNAELAFVRDELNKLSTSAVAPVRGFDPNLMPKFSMGPAEPLMKVHNSGGGSGIYFVDAFINPGEAGKTYLKVFEATRNTRLSESSVRKDSIEYTGWSNNPKETFFYSSMICVYEGDWGVMYPARFELWFQPSDRSKPARKLLERTYRISGWQR